MRRSWLRKAVTGGNVGGGILTSVDGRKWQRGETLALHLLLLEPPLGLQDRVLELGPPVDVAETRQTVEIRHRQKVGPRRNESNRRSILSFTACFTRGIGRIRELEGLRVKADAPQRLSSAAWARGHQQPLQTL